MEKFYYDKDDIMKRYDCGQVKAYQILQAIRKICGGGKLQPGKVLKSELEYWESLPDIKIGGAS